MTVRNGGDLRRHHADFTSKGIAALDFSPIPLVAVTMNEYRPSTGNCTTSGGQTNRFSPSYSSTVTVGSDADEPSGETSYPAYDSGCFMTDLCQALQQDDPSWSPTPWTRNRPAIHPNLMPEDKEA